jgi:hypothetical protein
MKILCMPILLAALIALCGCAAFSTSNESFEIYYDEAGFVKIHALPEKVDYEWLTAKPAAKGDFRDRQTRDAFIAHSATITPNGDELAALRAWLKKYDFARLNGSYPPHDPLTYGAAFHDILFVKVGNKKYPSSWTGDSDCPPELNQAATELQEILKRARESETPAQESEN